MNLRVKFSKIEVAMAAGNDAVVCEWTLGSHRVVEVEQLGSFVAEGIYLMILKVGSS